MVRASDCQCQIRNTPDFNPSILRHSGIWGASDETVGVEVFQKSKKIPLSTCRRLHLLYYIIKYKKILFPLTSRSTANRYILPCLNVTSDKLLQGDVHHCFFGECKLIKQLADICCKASWLTVAANKQAMAAGCNHWYGGGGEGGGRHLLGVTAQYYHQSN